MSSGPGSDPIDLTDTRFQLLDDSSSSVTGVSALTVTESGNSNDVLEPGERVKVEFDLDSDFSGNLDEGDSAEMTITAPSGSQTTEVLDVPDPIVGTDDVRL
jgi:archaellin